MKRKRCWSCHRRRVESAFRSRGTETRNTCRECENEQNKERRLELRRRVLEYLRNHACVDCGEDNPVVLEFDHVVGNKKKTVAELVKKAYSWGTVREEMSKCEVRCANCHRIKTACDFRYWIYDQEYGE